MKFDLVMWTKNAGSTFKDVLSRIDKVVPEGFVHEKFLVDDHSVDGTREVAVKHGWNVFFNRLGGIGNGANQALSYVSQEFFCSFEQDILLGDDWLRKVLPYLGNRKVGCIQGIRLFTHRFLRIFDVETQKKVSVVSMDNNVFRTEAVKSLGGYPLLCPCCVDSILYKKMNNESRWNWIIDKSIVSDHIRRGVLSQLKHQHWYVTDCARTKYCGPIVSYHFSTWLRLTLSSPLRGLEVAFRHRCPEAAFLYPYIRVYALKEEIACRVK